MVRKIHRIHLIRHLFLKHSNCGQERADLESKGWYKFIFTLTLGHTSVKAKFTLFECPEVFSFPEPPFLLHFLLDFLRVLALASGLELAKLIKVSCPGTLLSLTPNPPLSYCKLFESMDFTYSSPNPQFLQLCLAHSKYSINMWSVNRFSQASLE